MNKSSLLIVAVLICACTPPKKEANVNLGGYPPAFRAGYLDGCASSKRTSGQTKDEDRFKADILKTWRSFLLEQPFGDLGD